MTTVSWLNYWYDVDGERTVKTSGESDQVYVNSEFAGGRNEHRQVLIPMYLPLSRCQPRRTLYQAHLYR